MEAEGTCIVAGLTFFLGAVEVVSGSEGMFVLGY